MSNLPNRITGFKDRYRFLSNFEGPRVQFEGIWYARVENAYQAAKSDYPDVRLKFTNDDFSAGAAKALGQRIVIRKNWDYIKLNVMEVLVRQKFLYQEYLKMLLDTESAYLEETNYWHDDFWGNCICPKHINTMGKNYLGKILMDLRKEMMGFKVIFDPKYCQIQQTDYK